MIKGILPRELEEIATVQTERRSSSNRSKQTGDTGNGATNDMAPLYSEEALAQKFTERHASKARYVAAWGQWLRYDGISWVFDDTLHAFDDAREICREAAAACNKGGPAKTIASAKTVAAVEKLAKADRSHASTTNQWDAHPRLLKTPNGTIDLRTGKMRAHQPKDYLTKDNSCRSKHRRLPEMEGAPQSYPEC